MAGSKLEASGSPTGWLRFLLRAPLPLYRAGLGFLLGRRFLMLEHRGRKTGKIRSTALELVAARPDAVYVAAAWGWKADWLANIKADPRVTVHWGGRRFVTEAMIVDVEEARWVLAGYADNHPRLFARLAPFVLDEPAESAREQVEQMATSVPVVKLPID